jgi:hypothetical protein
MQNHDLLLALVLALILDAEKRKNLSKLLSNE